MAINSVDNSGMTDIYSSIFGNNSTSSSGGSNFLGDYAMIQNGAYKKLLTAYYAKQESAEKAEKDEETDSSVSLINTRTDANSLKESLEALSDKSLYKSTGVDEEGNKTYDRDKILSSVKDFVETYNSYLESSGELDSTSVLKKTLNMVKTTAANASLLSEVGITIGKDNKLKLDETKLNSAELTTLDTLFTGNASYGDRIETLAKASYKLANSQAYSNIHASSYTFDGTYSVLGTTNGLLDKYL